MNEKKHHLLCLGVLVCCYKEVSDQLKASIIDGIEAAIELDIGLPSDAADRVKSGKSLMGDVQ